MSCGKQLFHCVLVLVKGCECGLDPTTSDFWNPSLLLCRGVRKARAGYYFNKVDLSQLMGIHYYSSKLHMIC